MTTLMFFVLIIIVISGSALFTGLIVGIMSLDRYELKRRAQLGDIAAKRVYPIRVMGHQLLVTLVIIEVFINAVLVALLNVRFHAAGAVLIATICIVLFGELLPRAFARKYSLQLASYLANPISILLSVLAPISRPLGKTLDRWVGQELPVIHSKAQLNKIFDQHTFSDDSDIDEHDIRILRHALGFGEKQVRDVMTPQRMVVSVSVSDTVGPVLIDELHKSGLSRFPVYDSSNHQNFVGTLYTRDLIGPKASGTVADVMRKDVFYVHEEDQLDRALQAFLATSHHLLIVVNTFEEFVGVLSLEDVIEEIIGREITDEFDQHADLRAVAKKLAEKDKKLHQRL